MTTPPPNDPKQTKSKNEVDYALLDYLVEANPDLSEAQILKRYQQQSNKNHMTVALLSDDLNDATKVILASALSDPHPQNTQSQAQYRIDHRIDSGGQSHVYLAHRNDGTYQKTVVIKVLNQTIEGATQKQQLMAEMQILADLKHPNIVSILDAGIDDQQRPWLMLEFIPGEHIDQFVRNHSLNQRQLLTLFIRIAKALKYIHHNQVVHADIKPANILVEMVDDQPQPTIIDFGIACTQKTTSPDSPYIFATPAFASPEQLNSKTGQVDHRSDIYSFGQLIKHLLEIQPQQHSSKLNNQDLDAIIQHCVMTDASKRYQNTSVLLTDLERHQQDKVISVNQLTFSQLLSRKVRKFKGPIVLTLCVAMTSLFMLKHLIQQTKQNKALEKGATSSQQYWQSADDISNQSRLIYALPKRNIEPDFKSLNLKFDTLVAQLHQEPLVTQNLALLPLANAGISLGRFESAHTLLLKAYENNPNSTEVKFKLGKNYLILYQNELQTLHNFSQTTQRQIQRERLQAKYFEPALKLFSTVENQSYDDQLINSLLHYFEGHYDQALQQLKISESQLLWPIERLLLAAQITREQASQQLLLAQADEALPLLNQAFELLIQAKQIARSHPEVYKQLCQTESLLLQLQNHQNQINIASCDEYLDILPETAEALLVAADAYAQLAKSWLNQGQSPAKLLAHSRGILNHHWGTESNHHFAHAEQIKGNLLSTEGKWNLYSNQQFTLNFEQAIKHHQQAVNKQPNNYSAQLDLATAWYNLANNARYSEQHTDHYFNQATDLLTALTQHADSTQFLAVFLVRVFTDHAYIRYQNGLSADQQLELAEQWVKHTQADFPASLYAQLATATLYWTYSDYLVLQGKNPQPYLKLAIQAFDQVIAIEPTQWTNRYNQISAMLSGVTYYLQQGSEQTNQLVIIKDKLKELETWISSSINLDSHWGYYYNMMAINQLLLNTTPINSLQQAWNHNASCVDSPVDGYNCITQMMTSLVTETKWNLAHPDQFINYHASHTARIQQGILAQPNHHQLLALYGQYLWLNSQTVSTNTATKLNTLKQAETHLEFALNGNPLLSEKFSSDLTAIQSAIFKMTQIQNDIW